MGEPGTALERRPDTPVEVLPMMSDDEIRRTWRVASVLAQSGMFKDATQASQAFAKILLGRDLGLSPSQSMTGIHIVEGKPEMAATLMASFVRRHDDVDYRVLEHDDTVCAIEFGPGKAPGRDAAGEWKPWPRSFGVSRFTIEDADKAELTKPTRKGAPSMYVKYPRNMLFARAMSNGVKWLAPQTMRGIPVYHEGEIPRQLPAAVDGEPGGETGAGIEGFDFDSLLVSKELRKRAQSAVAQAPATWPPAKCEMVMAGLSEEELTRVVEQIERENDVAQSDPDVPAEDAGEPVDAEVVQPELSPEDRERVDALRHRLADLEASAEQAEPGSDEQASYAAEADQVEAEIRAVENPNQGSLDV